MHHNIQEYVNDILSWRDTRWRVSETDSMIYNFSNVPKRKRTYSDSTASKSGSSNAYEEE